MAHKKKETKWQQPYEVVSFRIPVNDKKEFWEFTDKRNLNRPEFVLDAIMHYMEAYDSVGPKKAGERELQAIQKTIGDMQDTLEAMSDYLAILPSHIRNEVKKLK